MNKTYVVFVMCCAALVACATPEPQIVDPCLAYNQGMRITSNREWPAAVDKAEDLKRQMRTASVAIAMKGPAEYDRLAEEYETVLGSAIRNAGACYQGSLFQRIVDRMAVDAGKLEELAERQKIRWRDSEEKRAAREVVVTNLPPDLKRHRLGDVEVEILDLRTPGNTIFKLRLTNVSEGQIVKTVTGLYYGFDADSPGVGGVMPWGFSLRDNYGNGFDLLKTDPKRPKGSAHRGLYPQESEDYQVIFIGHPPKTATEVTLTINRGTFGNNADHRIVFPRMVFLP